MQRYCYVALTLLTVLVVDGEININKTNSKEELTGVVTSLPDTIWPTKQLNSVKFCQLNDEACCNKTLQDFKANWMNGKVFLTRLLETLERANCSAFPYECDLRTFSYNRYTELVYDRFCDFERFQDSCSNGKILKMLFFD